MNELIAARRALSLMELTTLNGDDNDDKVTALCRQAQSPAGNTAAVCIYPRFVPAGGVLTAAEAASYLALADRIMGLAWADARHFRFGASSLLASVLQVLGHTSPHPDSGY